MNEDKNVTGAAEESKLQSPYQKKYDNIKALLRSAFKQLDKVQSVIESMEQEDKKAYYQGIPGTEGYFDGQYLIADDGRKTEVPGNYAAKSRLVYGDRLKVFLESGKQIFKQITKVDRKKIEGVLAKKEGSWYILANEGSYKIADVAAEFNKAELNDKAQAYIPLTNTNVPYAALDRILKEGAIVPAVEKKKIIQKDKKPVIEKTPEKKVAVSPKIAKKKPSKPKEIEEKNEKSDKEYVNNIMEEDDLR